MRYYGVTATVGAMQNEKKPAAPEHDELKKTSLRLPSKLWEDVKVIAVRTNTSAESLVAEALKRIVAEYEQQGRAA